MILSGNYPFLVYVSNIFKPRPDVIFKVICHRFLYYYDFENKNLIVETCNLKENGDCSRQTNHLKEHYIEAGDRIAVPLYFGDEYLEISLDLENGAPPTHDYQIVVGAKARCYPNEELGPPQKDTFLTLEEDDAYGGGKWEIKKDETDWKLKIKKYGPDPETEPVEIGQSTPG